MAKSYNVIWGHPVPYSLTVQTTRGISYGRIPAEILKSIEAGLRENNLAITRVEHAYVFYDNLEGTYSFLPIDVGFDLKRHPDIGIALTEDI